MPDALNLLTWRVGDPDAQELLAAGWEIMPFSDLLAHARPAAANRRTLDNPAAGLLERFRTRRPLALTGVRLDGPRALFAVYAYAMEPAWRAGCPLLVHADQYLSRLDPGGFVDAQQGWPWTLERALWLAARATRTSTPAPHPGAPDPARPLDAQQVAAIAAHDGVVQIIAPAGSGKTTVLVERVRELLRRGVPAGRVLCTTFSKAGTVEMDDRLRASGADGVHARTFHSLGAMITREERLAADRPNLRAGLSSSQWKRLAAMAAKSVPDGEWLDPHEAQGVVSDFKLTYLSTPREARAVFGSRGADARTLTALRIYELYEEDQAKGRRHDHDDQIMLAVRHLRASRDARERWQARFDAVLVDEYQDIEPAQELLVAALAAPQDCLFCVGDEDQTLYGWRRASVQRIVGLDARHPGLQRVALQTNYRCPAPVVNASAELISRNRIRFPKTITPGPAAGNQVATVAEQKDRAACAAYAADRLDGRDRGEIAVLARTTRLLREVAEPCAARGIRISAPDRVFEARGAEATVEALLRLYANPARATAEDVRTALRSPSRGLPADSEEYVANALRDGQPWRRALMGAPGADNPRTAGKLMETVGLLTTLDAITDDAGEWLATLRGFGGLDRYYRDHEKLSGGEQIDIETLDDLQHAAKGLTVAEFASRLEQARDALLAVRDETNGVELCTVHGAKGRQWPTVIVHRADDDQLPHRKALEVTDERRAAGEGLEAERRIMYVAMTRAQRDLHVTHTRGNASRFLSDAGLRQPPPDARPARQAHTARPATGNRKTVEQARLDAKERLNIPDQALEDVRAHGPAGAIARRPSARTALRLGAYLVETGQCDRESLNGLLAGAPVAEGVRGMVEARSGASPDTPVGALDSATRRRLAKTMASAAATARG